MNNKNYTGIRIDSLEDVQNFIKNKSNDSTSINGKRKMAAQLVVAMKNAMHKKLYPEGNTEKLNIDNIVINFLHLTAFAYGHKITIIE